MTRSEIETLAGRRLWIGFKGTELDARTRALLGEIRPGGVLLFRRNISGLEQAKDLITSLRELLGERLIIAVDQEGGLVVRFHQELTVFPGNMALGAIDAADPGLGEQLAERQGMVSALEMRGVGCDVNLAPDLDLACNGDNPGVGIRSLGADPERVGRLGAALVRGTLRGGVTPTVKHFPGLGGATVDPHLDLPRIDEAGAEAHLRPFEIAMAAGTVVAMTAHAFCPALDPDQPVTLSKRIVGGFLRERAGEDSVIMTDDLEMGAMTKRYGFEDVVRQTTGAGHDVLTICHAAGRQRQAFELLVRALERGEPWFGDAEAITRRLDGLSRRVPEPGATAEDGAALAREMAGRAVTVLRDADVLPVRPGHRTLIAFPALGSETGVEDPLRGEEDGMAFVRAFGDAATLHRMPLEPSSADVDDLMVAARDADRLVVVLTNARFLDGQARLARRAVTEHAGAILVPFRNPFDVEVVPPEARCAVVTAFGFRTEQLEALAAVIRGERDASGRMPIRPEAVTP